MAAKSKLTTENKSKILKAAEIDASVEEMAYLCGVTKQTIYNWFKEDTELFDDVTRLREKPVYEIRSAMVEKAKESYANAADYMKRKRRNEFGDSIEHTGEALKIVFDSSFNGGDETTRETE